MCILLEVSSTIFTTWWPSGLAAAFAINRSRVRIPAATLLGATLGKLFTHTCASVTKQYNLVTANGR